MLVGLIVRKQLPYVGSLVATGEEGQCTKTGLGGSARERVRSVLLPRVRLHPATECKFDNGIVIAMQFCRPSGHESRSGILDKVGFVFSTVRKVKLVRGSGRTRLRVTRTRIFISGGGPQVRVRLRRFSKGTWGRAWGIFGRF